MIVNVFHSTVSLVVAVWSVEALIQAKTILRGACRDGGGVGLEHIEIPGHLLGGVVGDHTSLLHKGVDLGTCASIHPVM